jgi:cation/acetate symporter
MELAGAVFVAVATFAIGAYGVRMARTTSDFFVASRQVGSTLNASAICGEYLSAASFLGAAALIMRHGASMLWLPIAYAAGYLLLLVFVAAPLRRFGAFTITDFAEGRFASKATRRVASGFVLAIGWFYLLPQLKGAGVTFGLIGRAPYWVGVVVVGAVVTANVAIGGMRAITFVQAFQYWMKVMAIAVPALVFLGHISADQRSGLVSEAGPVFHEAVTVEFSRTVTIDIDRPVTITVDGVVDGSPTDGSVVLTSGEHRFAAGARASWPEGSQAPRLADSAIADNSRWSQPFGSIPGDRPHPVYGYVSLLFAQLLGVMGLPHILVRFYTNPDGEAARRTTLKVMALLGCFYVFPAVHGAMGRVYAPELLVQGTTETVLLVLPREIVGGIGGELLAGLVAAGAMAAFLSTASGLLIAVAGTLSQDIFGGTVTGFRKMTVAAGAVAVLLALQVQSIDISVLVGWTFAIAASSLCPLLVFGIWWRGLSTVGAVAGMLVGGALSSIAIVLTMLGFRPGGWLGAVMGQPAAITAPMAFATMVLVSRRTAGRVPANLAATMTHIHLPETVGLARNWRD